MQRQQEVFVLAYGRTAIGSFQGCFGEISAVDLAAKCVEGVFDKFKLSSLKGQVEECIVGNVLSTGLGQGVANQIAAKAGFPSSTNCFTVGKVCSSGMKAVMLGAQSILTSQSDFVVCVGTESMSNVPHLLRGRNTQGKYGNRILEDCLIVDGLTDASSGRSMGVITEEMALKEQISRAVQDEYTVSSYERAIHAQEAGFLSQEIIPINGHSTDEETAKFRKDKIYSLKPAFAIQGTITAASSSKLSDGAAVLVLASRKFCLDHKIVPIAQIVDFAEATQNAQNFGTSPSLAISKLVSKHGKPQLYEINEAFSAVALVNMKALGLSLDECNVFGGAVSLGHPLGCSGARIICTLVNALLQHQLRSGIAAICHGGGGATAIFVKVHSGALE